MYESMTPQGFVRIYDTSGFEVSVVNYETMTPQCSRSLVHSGYRSGDL